MKIKPKKAPCICIKDNQLSQDICPVHSQSDKCLCNFHGLKNNACPVHGKPKECKHDWAYIGYPFGRIMTKLYRCAKCGVEEFNVEEPTGSTIQNK